MKIFEISVKVFLKREILKTEVQQKLTRFISSCMAQDDKYLDLHYKNEYKPFCFGFLEPISNKYLAETNYDFKIRTIDIDFANYILKNIAEFSNDDFKGLVANVKKIPRKHIYKIYCLTPVLLKNDKYWKNDNGVEFFEKRIYDSTIKKYKFFVSEDIAEKPFHSNMKFLNEKPIAIKQKDIKLLGDKVELDILDDENSQKLAYLIVGLGLGENNALGCGYVGYKYF